MLLCLGEQKSCETSQMSASHPWGYCESRSQFVIESVHFWCQHRFFTFGWVRLRLSQVCAISPLLWCQKQFHRSGNYRWVLRAKNTALTQVDCVNFTDPVLSPSSQGGGLVGDQCVGLVRPKLLSELPPRTNRLWRVGGKGFLGVKVIIWEILCHWGWIWQIAIYLSAG